MARVPIELPLSPALASGSMPGGTSGSTAVVSGADARHLAKVLRMQVGDAVVAFDGAGREWDARITALTPTRVDLALGEARVSARESRCVVLLGQGMGKGEKLELVVRATTELGVKEIVPVLTARAIAEGKGEGRVERWQKIAAEACKQCGRAVVPTVFAPESLEAFLARASRCVVKIVLWEGGGVSMNALPPAPSLREGEKEFVAVLVGPEGGLSADEVEKAKAAGFVAVSLGPRILRTETAGIVAVAVLQALRGDLA